MRRTYYKLVMQLKSPLSLGSGISDNTDSDVLLDSRGNPFIPATSLAGVIRHSLDVERAEELFGEIKNDGHASSIIIYDAVYIEEKGKEGKISVRDSVKLIDKVAEDMGKFDFEVVETGAKFVGYIELVDCDEYDDDTILEAIEKINLGLLRFGHKTSRGYGIVGIVQCQKQVFKEIDQWLDFDLFDENHWNNAEKITLRSDLGITKITLSLKQRQCSAVSIRSYATAPSRKNDVAPDYVQLSLQDSTPVIPGTSWAGVFRERFTEFTDEETCKELFGYIEKNKKDGIKKKSAIYFDESMILNAERKIITRNSIDRYTCGTNDGALYMEETVYNGNTELNILITKGQNSEVYSALMAVIADLDNGLLSVGGLSSIGRGLFTVEKLMVNGMDKTEAFRRCDFSGIVEVLANV